MSKKHFDELPSIDQMEMHEALELIRALRHGRRVDPSVNVQSVRTRRKQTENSIANLVKNLTAEQAAELLAKFGGQLK